MRYCILLFLVLFFCPVLLAYLLNNEDKTREIPLTTLCNAISSSTTSNDEDCESCESYESCENTSTIKDGNILITQSIYGLMFQEKSHKILHLLDTLKDKDIPVLFVTILAKDELNKTINILQNIKNKETIIIVHISSPEQKIAMSEESALLDRIIEIKEKDILSLKKKIAEMSNQKIVPNSNILQTSKKTSISTVILVRALCMLANCVLVGTEEEMQILSFLFGVPVKKIYSISADISSTLSSQIIPLSNYVLPRFFTVKNGLYALLSTSWLHINAEIFHRTIKSLHIRVVEEVPMLNKIGICERGPYNRYMYESFVSIESNNVSLRVHSSNTIQYKEGTIYVYVPGTIVKINVKTLDIEISSAINSMFNQDKKNTQNIQNKRGLAFEKTNKSKWINTNASNPFICTHNLLRHKINGLYAYLYNLPRRTMVESFDPTTFSMPLRRVSLAAHFLSGGYGLVSQEFLLSVCSDQRLFISIVFYGKALNDKKCFNDITTAYYKKTNYNLFLLSIYMKETENTDNIILSKLKKPSYTHKKVYLQNISFPDVNIPISPGCKFFIHFPWEFSIIPSDIEQPIIDKGAIVIVPSLFSKNAHIQSGMPPSRIYVVPHGVSFHTVKLLHAIEKNLDINNVSAQKIYNCTEKCTRFLILNGILARKGIDIAVSAYIKAFKENDNVVLYLQSAYSDICIKKKVQDLIMMNTKRNGPRIIANFTPKSSKVIRALLANAHYNISSFRGEGFGLGILEGQAFGAVPIISEALPAIEFCTQKTAMFIPCTTKEYKMYPVIKKNNQISIFNYSLPHYPIGYEPSLPNLVNILKFAHYIHTKKPDVYKKLRINCIKSACTKTWDKEMKKLCNLLLAE